MFGFFSKKKKKAAKAVKKKPAARKPPAAKAVAIPDVEAVEPAAARLDEAKTALDKRAATPPTDREKLIQQALAIQKRQAKLLENLDEDTKQRLRALAMKTLVFDRKDKKKLN